MGRALWCQQISEFKTMPTDGTLGADERQATPVFFPCSAAGTAMTALPEEQPSNVGVSIDGLFVWPTANTLRAAPLAN